MHGTPTSCCSDLRSLFITQEKQTKPDFTKPEQKVSKSNMNHRYHVDLCCESRTIRDCVWNIAGLWLCMSLAFTEIFSDNFEKWEKWRATWEAGLLPFFFLHTSHILFVAVWHQDHPSPFGPALLHPPPKLRQQFHCKFVRKSSLLSPSPLFFFLEVDQWIQGLCLQWSICCNEGCAPIPS